MREVGEANIWSRDRFSYTPLLMIPELDVAVNDDNGTGKISVCLFHLLLRQLLLSHLRMQALPQFSSQVGLL